MPFIKVDVAVVGTEAMEYRRTVSTNWPTTVEPTVRVQSCFPFVKSFIFDMV